MSSQDGQQDLSEEPAGERRRRLPSGAVISFVGVYVGVLLNYVLNLVLARELGVVEFGLIALGLSLLNLLGTVAQFEFLPRAARASSEPTSRATSGRSSAGCCA